MCLGEVSKGLGNCSAMVDFHIDGGREGLSALVGGCVKLWLLAPLTPKDCPTFTTHAHETRRIYRILPLLEGCLMMVTTSEEVVYLAASCLHANITLKQGFLTGIDFVTCNTIQTCFDSLIVSLDTGNSDHFQRDFDTFLESLSAALETIGTRAQALEVWIAHQTDERDRKSQNAEKR